MPAGQTPDQQRANPEHPGYTDNEWAHYTQTAHDRGLDGPWAVVEDINKFADDPFSTLHNVSRHEWNSTGFVEDGPVAETGTGTTTGNAAADHDLDGLGAAAPPAAPDTDMSRFVQEDFPNEDMIVPGDGPTGPPPRLHPGSDLDFGTSSDHGGGVAEPSLSFGSGTTAADTTPFADDASTGHHDAVDLSSADLSSADLAMDDHTVDAPAMDDPHDASAPVHEDPGPQHDSSHDAMDSSESFH